MSELQTIDPLLIKKLRAGNERAFHAIYLLLHKKIYHFALSFVKDSDLAQEITQEVFLQLWIHRESLSEHLPLYPFLFTKARQLTIDAFRKTTVVQRVVQELFGKNKDSFHTHTEDLIVWNDLNRITEEFITHLPLQQQRIFKMSRMEGRSYEEIAQELHISKNTVKYHLICALKALRIYFAKHDVLYILTLLLSAHFIFF